jgi:hypothetical protein
MAADRVTCCWKLVGKSCRKLVTGVPSRSHDCLRPHRCRRPGSVKGVACSTRPNGADHHRGRLGRLLPQPYRPLTAAAAAVPQIPGGDHGFHGGSASGGSVGLGSYHNPISKRCQTNFTHQGRPGRAGGCRPGRPPPGQALELRRHPWCAACLTVVSEFSQDSLSGDLAVELTRVFDQAGPYRSLTVLPDATKAGRACRPGRRQHPNR